MIDESIINNLEFKFESGFDNDYYNPQRTLTITVEYKGVVVFYETVNT